MRIERIMLRNFRGVESADVAFATNGVTIIQGQNEAGKTTIADAFTFLLDYKASSNHARVKALQPVGTDVAPEATAVFTLGSHRLTYRKRWLKGPPATELTIEGPSPAQLTGDDAHERVREMLAAETDEGLFRALRYQQGVELSQAQVGQSSSLIEALDAAGTGTPVDGTAQESLLERVDQERLRFFTRGGAVTQERRGKQAELAGMEETVAELQARLDELQRTADRQRQIDAELEQLTQQEPRVRSQTAAAQEQYESAQQLQREVERRRDALELARGREREASREAESRERLRESARNAEAEVKRLSDAITEAAPDLEAAALALSEAHEQHTLAVAERERLESAAAGHRRVVQSLELCQSRDELIARLSAAGEADREIEEAERFLAGCAVTQDLVSELETADRDVAVAQRLAAAGHGQLTVETIAPMSLTIDGEVRNLSVGQTLNRSLATPFTLEIADVAHLTLTPPARSGVQDSELDDAVKRREQLLGRAGVGSMDEARQLLQARTSAEQNLSGAHRRRDGALRGVDPPALQGKLESIQERLAVIENEPGSTPLGQTLEAASSAADDADTALQAARVTEAERGNLVGQRQVAMNDHEKRRISDQAQLTHAQESADRCLKELDAARSLLPDDQITIVQQQAVGATRAAAELVDKADADLAAADLVTLQATLENARALLSRIAEDRTRLGNDRASTQTELQIGGRDGLADRLAEALAGAEALSRELEAESRRAAAVERLHRVLMAKRESAQQRYARPYQQKLNSYARILYGAGVDVRINPSSFEIESRSLDGKTVPFEALSGGAREQLCVIARLACAAIVSPAADHGTPAGVPVIIDDALGYSDGDRLLKLGAAFTAAGRDAQVIVLTCVPGRYSSIGNAQVVGVG